MANISKQKRYAVLWLKEQNKTDEEISSELDISIQQIEKITNQQASDDQNKIRNASEPVSNKSKIHDSMITQSVAGKHRVAVMTKQASEISDESIKNNKEKKTQQPTQSFIFNPNE